MTLSQLESLNEDELSLLWFIVNKVNPPVMSWEMEPRLFCSIKHNRLVDRIRQCEKHIKPEHMDKFTGLKLKLGIN